MKEVPLEGSLVNTLPEQQSNFKNSQIFGQKYEFSVQTFP
jgi:hypothetical protein